MTFGILSETLRLVLPRREIRARDQRSFAYPVYSKTGDRFRTGRNKVWFDDGQTVLFLTGTQVFYPTTFRSGSNKAAPDLTGTLGPLTGNVVVANVDQWIPFRDQSESPGPFFDSGLFEQDQTNVVNSTFMTGTAFFVDQTSFRSKLSDKTIVRIEVPLTQNSTLTSNSSSLMYVNPIAGKLDLIKNERLNNQARAGQGNFQYQLPWAMDPVLFTPYGYKYMPSPDIQNYHNGFDGAKSLPWISTFVADGFSRYVNTASNVSVLQSNMHTMSLINPQHQANASQSISLAPYLAGPFLLEKAVVEFKFAAGASWLNDTFTAAPLNFNNGNYEVDVGGPMVTVGLLRQNMADNFYRDLIASATFTNALDILTSSYLVSSMSDSVRTDIVITRRGLSGMVNTSFVVSGTSLSSSTNTFTGSVKLVLEPSNTAHAWRYCSSGSTQIGFFAPAANPPTSPSEIDAKTESNVLFWSGPHANGIFRSTGREIFGRSTINLSTTQLDGTQNPVKRYESDYQNLNSSTATATGTLSLIKAFTDVVVSSAPCPYILYPQDNLTLCFNKARAAATSFVTTSNSSFSWVDYAPTSLLALHDAQVLTGTLRLTLYGDQIKNGIEFHDTLNQRLETEEVWQYVGEDPVVDQFDVAYGSELSGSLIDRFYVLQNRPNAIVSALSSSNETTRLFSSFAQSGSVTRDTTPWSTQYLWSSAKQAWELKQSSRNVKHSSVYETYWDCRLPDPQLMLQTCNPLFQLYNIINVAPYNVSNVISTGNVVEIVEALGTVVVYPYPSGALDFAMTYPYEQRYANIPTRLDLVNQGGFFIATIFNAGKITNSKATSVVSYANISFEFGDTSPPSVINTYNIKPPWYRSIRGAEGGVGSTVPEFIKYFYGIGDGYSSIDNQHIDGRASLTDGFNNYESCAEIRGWKYGMISGFAHKPSAVFRRDRFGQPRDMLEQRLDAKVHTDPIPGQTFTQIVSDSPVQVQFYDQKGNVTDPLRTLSSNVSTEYTSSVPYTDAVARNRAPFDLSQLNILNVVV